MTTPVNEHQNMLFISSAPSARPQLSAEEEQYVQELVSMPLHSILKGSGKETCKKLGQEIFNKAKSAHNGNSFVAKDVVVRICNAIHFSCNDGFLRKQYIELVWNGIGDDTWRWMA